MASGDLAYCNPRDFFICIPWEPPSCYTTTYNGFEYYYEDGQGGYYCGSGDYCPSGYIFFNQSQFGSGAFVDCTGSYCCTAYSNGIGSYYWNSVYYSGTILDCCAIYLNIENSRCVDNGCCYLISDGLGSSFYALNYCDLGFSFFKIDELIEYISDGTGYYSIVEMNPRYANDICINWDFSKRTKSKYNFNQIDACGVDILLSLTNSCIYFYEINSINETSICILEANQQKPLYIEDSCIPFIYIKNIGENNLNIKLSNNLSAVNFKENQIYNKSSYIDTDVLLSSKESIIFSVNTSTSGDLYYSNICYPFGFFYEFKNVDLINPLGVYPVCCKFDYLNNIYTPTYLYSDICNLEVQSGYVINTGYAFCYQKQLSFNEKIKADCYSVLEISFQKATGTGINDNIYINTGLQINSYYGCNLFNASFYVNEISISDENGTTLITNQDSFYSKNIESNSCINIVYDVDIDVNKCYNLIYLDKNSGTACYDLNLIKINSLNESFTFPKDELACSGGIIFLKNNETAYAQICLSKNSVIKDLSNKNIIRDNLFLPTVSEFEYNYCFELLKSNYIENKLTSGFWICDSGNININSGFCNYSNIIDCNNSCHQLYKSDIYNINLCNQENRKSTSSIQDKSGFVSSDDFYIPRTILECCFYFCDLEFRYNPVSCVLYRDNYYTIDNEIIQIEFSLSGNSEIINFPKDAINYDKLKINTNFEIFDTLKCSELNMNYFDFSLIKNYTDTNYINYNIPIIQCCNLSGYEYPQILIKNKIDQIRQTNINFDINPINKFTSDAFYGLNNFLLFVTSKLNSGIALDFINCENKLMCDYCYNSSEYNFLMMDLKSEYDCGNIAIPNVSWNNILQRISFDNNSIDLISYKNSTGVGYNYILPIVNCISFSDQFSGDSSIICSEINESGLLNYITTGFNYDGSSRSIIYLFDEFQNITGYRTDINSGSYFSFTKNNYFINLQASDITGQFKCRDINISKNYQFTGIQPFFIQTNYSMLDIKEPMVCNNLQKYCLNLSESAISGLYYYIYNINNPQNIPLKLLSPEFTYITDVCWGSNYIYQYSFDSKIGQIQNNSSKINLDINNLVYKNSYYLDSNCIQTICINMIGGL